MLKRLKNIEFKKLIVYSFFSLFSGVCGAASVIFAVDYCYKVYNATYNDLLKMTPPCFQTLQTPQISVFFYTNGGEPDLALATSHHCIPDTSINKNIVAYVFISFFSMVYILVSIRSFYKTWQEFFRILTPLILTTMFLACTYILLFLLSASASCYNQRYGLLFDIISYYGLPQLAENYNTTDLANPNCFSVTVVLSFVVLLPPSFFSFSLLMEILKHTKVLSYTIILIMSIFFVNVVHILLNYYFPTVYLPPCSDGTKFAYRIAVFNVVLEFIFLWTRYVILKIGAIDRTSSLMFYCECFNANYSRLLVNSISNAALLAGLSVLVSFFDFLSKTTSSKRDKLVNSVISKALGKNIETSKESLLLQQHVSISKTIFENASIISVSAFYIVLLMPKGPLYPQKNPVFDSARLATLGFNITTVVVESAAIQIGIEIATLIILFMADSILNLSLFTISIKSILLYCIPITIFYTAFVFYFISTLFEFPRLWQKQSVYFTYSVYDLASTWIFYVSKIVQTSYLIEWFPSYFG